MGVDTINSTINGKAYEYANVIALLDLVKPLRPIEIIENSSLKIARSRYLNDITDDERKNMLNSARAGIEAIIKMEPRIIEDGKDTLTVEIQSDDVARAGDIRDVLIIRRDIKWQIGISVKHNHEALKHSRLSATLDFGRIWYGIPSSQVYFDEVSNVFAELKSLKERNILWRDLPDKEQNVYIPILNAFLDELKRAYDTNGDLVTAGLVRYLLGSNGNDYYKLIHHNNHTTRVIPCNIYGSLNKASANQDPSVVIPSIDLPTRIIEFTFKDNSKTTVDLVMNNGWAISFRIHNASSRVEPSLKFDIQLFGQPSNLFYVDVAW